MVDPSRGVDYNEGADGGREGVAVKGKSGAFAARLRALREQAGLSQYALAKRSGLSKQALSRLELGENEPAWETVQLLALALGVDCREFVNQDLGLPPGGAEPGRPKGRPRAAPREESPAADAPGGPAPVRPPGEKPAPKKGRKGK